MALPYATPGQLDRTKTELSNTIAALAASGVPFLTTAPTEANTDGLKFVVLSADPATKYDGYFYIITTA